MTFDTTSTSAADFKTVIAECGNDVTANAVVVAVDKIEVQEGGSWVDRTGQTISVLVGTTIPLRAVIVPANASWPSGCPQWGGEAAGKTGDEIEVTFNSLGQKQVSAGPYTQTVNVNVVDPNVTIETIKGLYDSSGAYTAGYTSDDNLGRIYSNRTYSANDPTTAVWNQNKQYVDFSVRITTDTTLVLPSGARIVWEALDPDDPSDDGMTTQSAVAVDPKDYDSNDSDNDGLDKDGTDNGANRDGASEWEEISGYGLSNGNETEIKNGVSKVRFNATDDGGDNFIVKVKFKYDDTQSTPQLKCQTGIMTVWKRMDAEYRKMISGNTLPVDQVQAHYNKAFVEWHFHDEGSSDSYEYIEPTPGSVEYCKKYTGSIGQFHHRGDGGWCFLDSARKYSTYLDATPYGAQTSGTATVQSDTVLVDANANFTPGQYGGGTKLVEINPGTSNAFTFMIVNNTATEVTIYPFYYTEPNGTIIRSLHLRSTELNFGTTVTYAISEGGLAGITPDAKANTLIFYETVTHIHSERQNPPSLGDMLLSSLVHELMHGFSLDHNCGHPDVTGTKSCVSNWEDAPVFYPDNTYAVLPGSMDFCGKHLRAIRDSDGFGG